MNTIGQRGLVQRATGQREPVAFVSVSQASRALHLPLSERLCARDLDFPRLSKEKVNALRRRWRRGGSRFYLIKGSGLEHGHEDAQHTVSDAPNGTPMGMPTGTVSGVARFDFRVESDRRMDPVVNRVPKAVVACVAHRDRRVLATSLSRGASHGSYARQGTKRCVVAFAKRKLGLHQKDGSNHWADARDGQNHGRVRIGTVRGLFRERVEELPNADLAVFELLVDEAKASDKRADSNRSRGHHAIGNRQWPNRKNRLHGLGRVPSNAVAAEDAGDLGDAESLRKVGSGCELQERPYPASVADRVELQDLGKIASKLIDESISRGHPFGHQLLVKSGELAELNDKRRACMHLSKGIPVGSKGVRQNEGVAAVVLGSGGGMSVTEAIELLGVDGEYGDAAFKQGLHDGSTRCFDGDGDRARFNTVEDCVREVVERLATVNDDSLEDDGTVWPKHADLMFLRTPVDSNKSFGIVHARLLLDRAVPARPRRDITPVLALYGATSHRTCVAVHLAGAQFQIRSCQSRTGGDLALTDEVAETTSV
jgi:hypothetical protein